MNANRFEWHDYDKSFTGGLGSSFRRCRRTVLSGVTGAKGTVPGFSSWKLRIRNRIRRSSKSKGMPNTQCAMYPLHTRISPSVDRRPTLLYNTIMASRINCKNEIRPSSRMRLRSSYAAMGTLIAVDSVL